MEEISGKPDSNSEHRCQGLDAWLFDVLSNLELPGGSAKNWNSFVKRDESLANLSRLYLVQKGLNLPSTILKNSALTSSDKKNLDSNIQRNNNEYYNCIYCNTT